MGYLRRRLLLSARASASMACMQNGDFMIADCSQQFAKRYDEQHGLRAAPKSS